MTEIIDPGFGLLGVTVWPTYLGLASDDPGPGPVPLHEPFEDFNYDRGMISWRTLDDGTVLGSARVYVPQGVYGYFVFCYGPIREMMAGPGRKMDHPVVFDRAGFVDVDPIVNTAVLPQR